MNTPESTLWLTLPAPPRSLLAGWLAWLLAAGLLALAGVEAIGVVGVATAIAVAGVCAARRLANPLECLRRHHLDSDEITRMGPGRAVVRTAWSAVSRCAQARDTLVLLADGRRVSLPLRPLIEAGGWGPVLARVVPGRAEALWCALDGGTVALGPALDPTHARMAAWCWIPLLAAAAVTAVPMLAVAGIGLALFERVVVRLRQRMRTVVLQPGGIVVPGNRGRFFAPWDDLTVETVADGLRVRSPRGTGLVSAEVDDFWAAAAVIELHAQLGFLQPDLVRFRVHVDGAEIAVVGEVEAA